jgi:hypothetical protein
MLKLSLNGRWRDEHSPEVLEAQTEEWKRPNLCLRTMVVEPLASEGIQSDETGAE